METNTLFQRHNRTQIEVADEIDDSILNRSYDKAVRVANAEIAKRIAMATNSKQTAETKKSQKIKSNTLEEDTAKEWKAGMPCRAIYSDDGEEYEATIVRMVDDDECIVRYIGYNNTEIVPISCLKPSLGSGERMKQLEETVQQDPSIAGLPSEWTEVDAKDKPQPQTLNPEVLPNLLISDKITPPKKKTTKKKRSSHNGHISELPNLPNLPAFNVSMLKNLGSSDIPMPPPPPPINLSSDRSETEEQAISTMLLSWYMTGYYTGLYQGMKRERENHNHKN